MARGWESKAVADQIEEGKPEPASVPQSTVTPEERERRSRLSSLQLSKARLLDQLDRAKHPAYRQVLLNGLQAVEKEIEELTI
ncbi:MAG TPA: hypothetical protein VIX17_25825 [Pyrinomonadaceae bacterium]|jgi:hypothetical protein